MRMNRFNKILGTSNKTYETVKYPRNIQFNYPFDMTLNDDDLDLLITDSNNSLIVNTMHYA